jgi:hypothetical protein
MKALLAVLAIVLLAFFVVRQPDGEAAGTGGEGTGFDDAGSLGSRCTVYADAPALARDGLVLGPARYRCAKADGGVDVTVYLQVQVAGSTWTNVDKQPMAATGADTTRDRAEKHRTVLASGRCVPGAYRTFVGGTVSNGDRSYPVEAVSTPVTIPCATASPTA